MRSIKIFALVLIFMTMHGTKASAANAGNSSSGQTGDTIEVIATGIGQDSNQALKNALRAAIEQAVGTMVDSETLADNDEVVNDQILSYSAGFVESHKVIGEPRTRDGLVTIKIQAQVKRTQLTERLKAANIHVKTIDGESLFGEVFTKMDQKESSIQILQGIFEGFPENVLSAKMSGKPSYDVDRNKIQINWRLSVDPEKYAKYTNELCRKLDAIAEKKETKIAHPSINQEWMQISEVSFHELDAIAVIVCRQINESRSSSKWDVYYLSKDLILSAMRNLNVPELHVEIVDKNGDMVVGGNYNIFIPFVAADFNYKPHVLISPILCDPLERNVGFFQPGTFFTDRRIEFEASQNEIKKMSNIIMKVQKGELLSEISHYREIFNSIRPPVIVLQ